jgi:DNA-binding response OmpR family regulator
MRKQPAAERTCIPVPINNSRILDLLIVSPDTEDTVSLERIKERTWAIMRCNAVDLAINVLRAMPLPIVLCDTDLTSSTWQEMLESTWLLADPPLLIVTSRVADDYLWAEALNLGAWDVLAKPFEAEEVNRVIGFAWRHWQERHGTYNTGMVQRRAATGT